MRLIDADATIEFLAGFGNREYRSENGTIREAIKALKYAEYTPTVDAVPVVHAHWLQRGGRSRCSNCDGLAGLKDTGGTGGWSHEYEYERSSYCPHCGAKMDGGRV